MSESQLKKDSGSFRDPSGFIFYNGTTLLRQINTSYAADYDALMSSGLYQKLTEQHLLIPHSASAQSPLEKTSAHTVIEPERVEFISYPYEWSFSQLKDAALATLKIQLLALDHGMTLKDASAYNIQFQAVHPLLIDTLSFEAYQPGQPWVAYQQFCRHFLAPLSLMAQVDGTLNSLLKDHIDGLPLDLTSRLLPYRSRLQFGLLTHIHLHAGSQKAHANSKIATQKANFSPLALRGLIESLQSTVLSLKLPKQKTKWGDYYTYTNYSDEAFEKKQAQVAQLIAASKPKRVWDVGANTGVFSRLASEQGIFTISTDIDPLAVDRNYRMQRKQKETNLIPLLLDCTNPSPGIGWKNKERSSFADRLNVDLTLALAIIHHLFVTHQLGFDQLAEFFASNSPDLVMEFVPSDDSQFQTLAANRPEVFAEYTQEKFEAAFQKYFTTLQVAPVEGSTRLLYHLRRKK